MAEKTGTRVNVSGDNKKLYMILGIAAVAGFAIWFMTKDKKSGPGITPPPPGARLGDDIIADLDDELEEEIEEEEIIKYSNGIRIGNALGMGKYKWYSVASQDRAKSDAALQIGTSGMINGTSPCTINNFWIDSNGRKAAFRCDEVADGTYDIPGGSRFEW